MNDLVLVTGGSGYLAAWCIVSLLRRGYRVRSDADQKQLAAADGSLRHAATAPNDDFYWGRLPGQVKK